MLALLCVALGASLEPTGVEGLHRLQPRQVLASSSLQNGWNSYEQNYLPQYAVDDDATTAWVEGSPSDGTGESFTWRGPELTQVSQLKIALRNGYQKSKALYQANTRAKSMRIEVLGAKDAKPVVTEVKLADDEAGWQTFELPVSGAFTGVRLTVTSTYAGKRYTDLCLSDLRVYVAAKDVYRPEREAAAFEIIKAWAAERQARAKQGLKPQPGAFAATYVKAPAKDAAALEASARAGIAQLAALLEKPQTPPAGWRSARVSRQRGREVDYRFLEDLEFYELNSGGAGLDSFGQLIAADLVAWDDVPKRPSLAQAKALMGLKNIGAKCRALFGDEPGLDNCITPAGPGDSDDDPTLGLSDVERLVRWSNHRFRAVHGDLKTFDAIVRADPGYYGEREIVESDGASLVHFVEGHADVLVFDATAASDSVRTFNVFLFSWKGDVVSRVCELTVAGDAVSVPLTCVESKG